MTQIHIPNDLVNVQQIPTLTKLLLELSRPVADSELGKGCKGHVFPVVSFNRYDYVLQHFSSNRHEGLVLFGSATAPTW